MSPAEHVEVRDEQGRHTITLAIPEGIVVDPILLRVGQLNVAVVEPPIEQGGLHDKSGGEGQREVAVVNTENRSVVRSGSQPSTQGLLAANIAGTPTLQSLCLADILD